MNITVPDGCAMVLQADISAVRGNPERLIELVGRPVGALPRFGHWSRFAALTGLPLRTTEIREPRQVMAYRFQSSGLSGFAAVGIRS